jgi:hypothetical protein
VTHLGDRVSALVDGQLPVEAAERAHAHLASCRACRDAVEVERALKSRLVALGEPTLPGDLLARLVSLGGPDGPLPPRAGHVPGSPRPVPVPLRAPEPVRVEAGLVGAALAGAGAAGRPLDRHDASRALRTPAALVRAPGYRLLGGRTLLGVSPAAVAAPAGASPGSLRPGGRPGDLVRPPARTAGARRVRFAGAVLGALGVVGAGVGGLVLVTETVGAAPRPSAGVLDSFTVTRTTPAGSPSPSSTLRPEDVSFRPGPSDPSSSRR